MTRLRTTLGVAAAIAASTASLVAAHSNDPALAKLPKEIQPMHCLVGEWNGTASFQMGNAPAGQVKVKMTCEAASLGFGIACRSSIDGIPGVGKGEETDLFGYDAGKNQYHWFAVTNMGETHDHVAEVSKNGTLEFVYHGVQEGKPMVEAIRLTFSEDGKHMKLRNDGTVGGSPAWVMDGNATKK